MRHSVILSACRTPIGKFRGSFSALSATELGAVAVRAAVAQSGIDPAEVEEVICGNVLSTGLGQAPARQAALHAGLPPTVAALTVNKVCGSSLKAVMLADQAIRSGDAQLIVAAGMESMTRAGWFLPREDIALGDRRLQDVMLHDGLSCAFNHCSMGEIAERMAQRLNISREDQDRYALQSHRRAIAAIEAGLLGDEIAPVQILQRQTTAIVERDEGPRANSTLESLAGLPSVFAQPGSVTAGNASTISDGAAALVIATESVAKRVNRSPIARILASATSGMAPENLFIAPVDAIRKVVAKANYRLDDVELFEINEAFAVQMLACIQQLGLSHERVNVHGGAIALGHPIGASGARVLVTLLNAMQHRNVRLGVAALCLGGGNAVALLVERDVT